MMKTDVRSTGEKVIETVKSGEMFTSDLVSVKIITRSLGSGVAAAAYDPVRHLGGILNFLLPKPMSREVERLHPLVFGSIAIPAFLNELFDLGANSERLVVKIAGGSVINGLNQIMRIGQQNREIARSMFREFGIEIATEASTENPVRSLHLEIETGKVLMELPFQDEVEL